MVDENALNEELAEWLENPYWADYYEKAPSEQVKRFIALSFYYSENEDDESAAEMDEIEKSFSLADWKYLYDHCDNSPEKGRIATIIANMEEVG